MSTTRRHFLTAAAATAGIAAIGTHPARAEDAAVIDARVNLALERLYAEVPGTRDLAQRALGILVMPEVIKGGFIVGASYGEGALRLNDGSNYRNTAEYYSVAAGSVGFQAGLQTSAHALFFLSQGALDRFRRSDGWEVGADAEVTFPDAGASFGADSTTTKKPIVGIIFGQDGLLVGASLEGAKYSRIVR